MYAQVEKTTSSIECNFVCTMCNFVRLMKRCHFISTLGLPQEIGQQYAAMQNFLFIDEKFCVQILPSPHTSFYNLVSTFFFLFWRARVCCHYFAYVAHFVVLIDVWDSNPQSCRSKQARYQLIHPSSNLATHLPT
jgi:hypothetical protein